MMGISTEDKYLIKSFQKMRNMNKNWSLGGLTALIKKLTTQVPLFDVRRIG